MPKAIQRSELLVSLQKGDRTPLRLQLERRLRHAVQTGRLAPGTLLPSTRVFSSELGVSRGLVVEAYDQLLAEGYLSSRRGSSTYVSDRHSNEQPLELKPEVPPAPRFDFRPGRPDYSLFPQRAWVSALRRVFASAPAAAFDYPDARGAQPARTSLAAFLNRSRATSANAERTLLCTGSAQGIRLACEVLRTRGVRRIAVEDPGHAYESADVRASGLELVAVPVDACGLCVNRLAGLKVGAVFVTPAHQYPTGAVLSPERRTALLAWAKQQGAFVLEDDYDGEYRYDREPIGALQGLAPERVIYIGSASKTLAPSLRIGWVLSPACLISELATKKMDADRGSPGIDQLALAEFINGGHLDRHLRRTRLIYSRRRALLASALDLHLHGRPIRGVAAGLHLSLELPSGSDEKAIIAEARRRGIHVYGMSMYRAKPKVGPPALLFGYCRLSEKDLHEGAKALAAVVKKYERTR